MLLRLEVQSRSHDISMFCIEKCKQLEMVVSSKAPVPQSLQPHCDLAATKKSDNRREVAEVAARFYKGCSKVGNRSP